jgi:hypothetical protein
MSDIIGKDQRRTISQVTATFRGTISPLTSRPGSLNHRAVSVEPNNPFSLEAAVVPAGAKRASFSQFTP